MNNKFKENTVTEPLNKRISKSLSKTFYSAKLRIVFSSRRTIHGSVKNKLTLWAIPMCIYQFTCPCGTSYVTLAKRSPSKCISEHYSMWLLKGEFKTVTSLIQQHRINSEHVALKESPFIIIDPVKGTGLNGGQIINLCTTEILTIHQSMP